MKTYDNKILRNIINNFNNDNYYLTLDRLSEKMEALGFISCQDLDTAISRNYLVYSTMIDDEFVNVFISYLPHNLFNVAELKTAYQEFVSYISTHNNDLDYKKHDTYKQLEYLYRCVEINVQFLYVEEED